MPASVVSRKGRRRKQAKSHVQPLLQPDARQSALRQSNRPSLEGERDGDAQDGEGEECARETQDAIRWLLSAIEAVDSSESEDSSETSSVVNVGSSRSESAPMQQSTRSPLPNVTAEPSPSSSILPESRNSEPRRMAIGQVLNQPADRAVSEDPDCIVVASASLESAEAAEHDAIADDGSLVDRDRELQDESPETQLSDNEVVDCAAAKKPSQQPCPLLDEPHNPTRMAKMPPPGFPNREFSIGRLLGSVASDPILVEDDSACPSTTTNTSLKTPAWPHLHSQSMGHLADERNSLHPGQPSASQPPIGSIHAPLIIQALPPPSLHRTLPPLPCPDPPHSRTQKTKRAYRTKRTSAHTSWSAHEGLPCPAQITQPPRYSASDVPGYAENTGPYARRHNRCHACYHHSAPCFDSPRTSGSCATCEIGGYDCHPITRKSDGTIPPPNKLAAPGNPAKIPGPEIYGAVEMPHNAASAAK